LGLFDPATADAIAVSQTVTGANNVIINGVTAVSGVAFLDAPRRVLVTNVGNDTGITFHEFMARLTAVLLSSEVLQGTSGSSVSTTVDFASCDKESRQVDQLALLVLRLEQMALQVLAGYGLIAGQTLGTAIQRNATTGTVNSAVQVTHG